MSTLSDGISLQRHKFQSFGISFTLLLEPDLWFRISHPFSWLWIPDPQKTALCVLHYLLTTEQYLPLDWQYNSSGPPWTCCRALFTTIILSQLSPKQANIPHDCEYSTRLQIFHTTANSQHDCNYSTRLQLHHTTANIPHNCKYSTQLQIIHTTANIPHNCKYFT